MIIWLSCGFYNIQLGELLKTPFLNLDIIIVAALQYITEMSNLISTKVGMNERDLQILVYYAKLWKKQNRKGLKNQRFKLLCLKETIDFSKNYIEESLTVELECIQI